MEFIMLIGKSLGSQGQVGKEGKPGKEGKCVEVGATSGPQQVRPH